MRCGGAPVLRPGLSEYRKHLKGIYLVDIESQNATLVRDTLGWGEIRVSYHDVLGDVDVILLPNDMHYGVTMDCLNAGVHVLCEKPLAVDPEHAREMVSTAERSNLALCVNNTRRMFPTFRAVRDAIVAGEIGRVTEIEYVEGNPFGWQSSTGFYVNPRITSKGVLLDLGPHVIDTVSWWLGGSLVLSSTWTTRTGGLSALQDRGI